MFENRTWKTVFLIGQTNSSQLNWLIQREARTYGDIVIGDFLDSYRNLYRKMILSIEWPAKHCAGAQYILKTDEDCYVNVAETIKWLEAEQERDMRTKDTLYAGAVNENMHVVRDPSSRYFVSKEAFPQPSYYPYVAGGGYVFSGGLLPKLLESSKNVRIFPVEDASFGLIMHHVGIRPRHNTRFIPFTMELVLYCADDEVSDCPYYKPIYRPLCELRDPLVIHDVYGKEQLLIHFNVLIISHVPTICTHLNRVQSYRT